MAYLHNVKVGPRSVTVDGSFITCRDDVTVDLAMGIPQITLTLFCEDIVLDGDNHTTAEETPIYDALLKEAG